MLRSPTGSNEDGNAQAIALSAIESLPGVALVAFDREMRYVLVTGQAFSDRDWDPARLRGRRADEVLPEAVWRDHAPHYRAALAGESSSVELRSPDGSGLFQLEVNPWRDESGAVIGGIAVARDVTTRRRMESELRESQEHFELAFEGAPIGMALIGLDGSWLKFNRRVLDITGYSAEELSTKTFQDITHPDDLEADLEHIRELLDGEIDRYQMEKRYYRADGSIVWIMLSVSLVHDAEGEPVHFISQIEDITERRKMEDRLRWLADHDPLTGVRSRRLLEEDLFVQVSRCQRYGERAALLMIDLDDFKGINDTHGHKAGDDTLKSVAIAIADRVRGTDSVARLGGDEFAVLMPHVVRHDAEALVGQLEATIAACEIPAGGAVIRPSASIGYALIDELTASDESVLIEADRSMYAAKERRGRS
ncbi:MAG: diguanylate cyclase [Solirubrobacterales bacterium]